MLIKTSCRRPAASTKSGQHLAAGANARFSRLANVDTTILEPGGEAGSNPGPETTEI